METDSLLTVDLYCSYGPKFKAAGCVVSVAFSVGSFLHYCIKIYDVLHTYDHDRLGSN